MFKLKLGLAAAVAVALLGLAAHVHAGEVGAAGIGKGEISKRLHLRAFLVRQQATGKLDAATRDAVKKAMSDPKAFNECFQGLTAEHAHQSGGPLQDFFTWLIEHKEEVLAFIKMIISLFAQDDLAIGPQPFQFVFHDGVLEDRSFDLAGRAGLFTVFAPVEAAPKCLDGTCPVATDGKACQGACGPGCRCPVAKALTAPVRSVVRNRAEAGWPVANRAADAVHRVGEVGRNAAQTAGGAAARVLTAPARAWRNRCGRCR